MRIREREDIFRFIEKIEPDDFDFIKINYGMGRHRGFGYLNKKPVDALTMFLFDLSLRRRITSITIVDGGCKFSSPLVIGTTESCDGTTNIDADVIEAIALVLKNRINADYPTTKQHKRAE